METIHVYGTTRVVLPGIDYAIVGGLSVTLTTTTTIVMLDGTDPMLATLGSTTWRYVHVPIQVTTINVGDTIPQPTATIVSLVGDSVDINTGEAIDIGVTTIEFDDGTLVAFNSVAAPVPPTNLPTYVIDSAQLNKLYEGNFGAIISISPLLAAANVTGLGITLTDWGTFDDVIVVCERYVVRFILQASIVYLPAGRAFTVDDVGKFPTNAAAFEYSGLAIVFKPSSVDFPYISVDGMIEYRPFAVMASSQNLVTTSVNTTDLAFFDFAPFVGPVTDGIHTLSYLDGSIIFATIALPSSGGGAGTPVPIELYYLGTGSTYPLSIVNADWNATIYNAANIVWNDPLGYGDIVGSGPIITITPPYTIPTVTPATYHVTYDGKFQFIVRSGYAFLLDNPSLPDVTISLDGLFHMFAVPPYKYVIVNEVRLSDSAIVAIYTMEYTGALSVIRLEIDEGAALVINDVVSAEVLVPGATFASGQITIDGTVATDQVIYYSVALLPTDVPERYAGIINRVPVTGTGEHIIYLLVDESIELRAGYAPDQGSGYTITSPDVYRFDVAGTYTFTYTGITNPGLPYRVVVSSRSDFITAAAVVGTTWEYGFSNNITVISLTINSSPIATIDYPTYFTIIAGTNLSVFNLVIGTMDFILQNGQQINLSVTGPNSLASKTIFDILVTASPITNYASLTDYLLEISPGIYSCIRVTTSALTLNLGDGTVTLLDINPRVARLGTVEITQGGTALFDGATMPLQTSIVAGPDIVGFTAAQNGDGSPGNYVISDITFPEGDASPANYTITNGSTWEAQQMIYGTFTPALTPLLVSGGGLTINYNDVGMDMVAHPLSGILEIGANASILLTNYIAPVSGITVYNFAVPYGTFTGNVCMSFTIMNADV